MNELQRHGVLRVLLRGVLIGALGSSRWVHSRIHYEYTAASAIAL